MIVPAEVRRRFNQSAKYIELSGKKIKEQLSNYCSKNGYAFLWRVKELESISEKIETGRYSKWSDLDDLFACSIIVPSLKHEAEVLSFLETVYPSIKVTQRNTKKKAPDVFRFDTTRYISEMFLSDGSVQKFEIQIRTVFEHAWITTTHDLVYKNNILDWKRLRLASEMKANIELLDNIVMSFEENTSIHIKNNWPEIETKVRLQNFIFDCFDSKILPDEYLPRDISRMVDNFYKLIKIDLRNLDDDKKNIYLDDLFNFLKIKFHDHLKSNSFPLSISLHQFIFGLLHQEDFIKLDSKLNFAVTNELKLFFSATATIKSTFDFNG